MKDLALYVTEQEFYTTGNISCDPFLGKGIKF